MQKLTVLALAALISIVPVAVCYGDADGDELAESTAAATADSAATDPEASAPAVSADTAAPTPEPDKEKEFALGLAAEEIVRLSAALEEQRRQLVAAEAALAVEARDADDDWYGQLEERSGAMWLTKSKAWLPYVTIPLGGYRGFSAEGGVNFDPNVAKGPIDAVFGVTYNLGNLRKWGVDLPWAEHLGVAVGPVISVNFVTGEKELAFVASILDLSFNEGNVDRQRNR